MALPKPEELGDPDLRIDGLQIWVHGYQFPDSTDYWDGNWLRVTAHCGAAGASVWASGAILMVSDIVGFADRCDDLREKRAEAAELKPLEPELKVLIRPIDRFGHLSVTVHITPEHLTQSHSFEYGIDQTYLPEISGMCRKIVRAYPLRGDVSRRGPSR